MPLKIRIKTVKYENRKVYEGMRRRICMETKKRSKMAWLWENMKGYRAIYFIGILYHKINIKAMRFIKKERDSLSFLQLIICV